jgi:hypothetical protein
VDRILKHNTCAWVQAFTIDLGSSSADASVLLT